MERVLRLVVVLLSVVAVVLVGVAVVLGLQTRAFLADSVTAPGTVVELVARTDCDRDDDGVNRCTTTYAPRVRFTAADGREVVFTSPTSSSPASQTEGDVVTVRYRPGSPADARIDSVAGVWLSTLVVGGIGLVFTFFAVLWAVIARIGRGRSD